VKFLTDFADQSVLLPLCALLIVGFALSGWRRGAWAWAAAAGVTFGVLVILKVILLACGWRWTDGMLNSPSGHTASAALVYGGLAAVLIRQRWPRMRWLAVLPAALAAVLIGASRLALHVHTWSDVLAGAIIGVAGVALLIWLAGVPPMRLRLRAVVVPGIMIAFLLHGERLRAEQMLRHLRIDGFWPPSACVLDREAGQAARAAAGAEVLNTSFG
jgi:membrane-associated phospholipid phosphatase